MKINPWFIWTLVSVVYCDTSLELNKDYLEFEEGNFDYFEQDM